MSAAWALLAIHAAGTPVAPHRVDICRTQMQALADAARRADSARRESAAAAEAAACRVLQLEQRVGELSGGAQAATAALSASEARAGALAARLRDAEARHEAERRSWAEDTEQ